MRRKDREMNRDFGLRVIDNAPFGVLSIVNNGEPYAMPLSIVRNGDNLYFHSAKAGTKVDLFESCPVVCLTFVTDVKVPDLFSREELEAMLAAEDRYSDFGSKVFTTEYASAVVFGPIARVEDDAGRLEALRIICLKYTPDKIRYFDAAAAPGLKHTDIYRVAIERLTAKRKKFDGDGQEMKWGRVE
ncbi:pyridoxamine 5'-phosphate oxidase family protein [Limibacterium fermenti]|uniref:pyridoxamine 5'-phosphate oxidase family protein n=1 Tax=Limibacterium fermenti TaxID=3229863 RepID=UPI000E91D29F|nr:5-nitroimidazole antibiotic resistance protein [Porphyromonadaceae bacterium]